jgi:hypothetical protein
VFDGCSELEIRRREKGFNVSGIEKSTIPEYDPLFDTSLAHYFGSKNVRRHMYRSGLVDREGRILDVDKHRQKLQIIDQEFRLAEREELRLLQEEGYKRHARMMRKKTETEEMHRMEIIAKIKVLFITHVFRTHRHMFPHYMLLIVITTAATGGSKEATRSDSGEAVGDVWIPLWDRARIVTSKEEKTPSPVFLLFLFG